jgi:putative addiction module component (TIGR02574 family)
MTARPTKSDKILAEALKLSAVSRARLAAELIASVDGEADEDAHAAWAAEIDRRVRRVEAEGTSGDDWQKVHARIAARLRSK